MVGVDELVRGYQAIFLTQLDRIESVYPRKTRLIADNSNGFRRSKLFLEAQLREQRDFVKSGKKEAIAKNSI
ncbi:Superfamily II DNA or RNA helicase, SNF2 family [Nostoc flagelliforme CCNUN1]|uniref:Superfamily II DNA or RNA helicase, SNF2 family n=1 Tax=Nostoc flagelliforme CCNUN1 TaxID=2038116 RepID=A0A2K8SHI5_9NOSO|nr:Superfamily II DNA or RNA helicase, SNF2 family [Nostoc flagelliforme CCNUN1]